MSFYIAGTLNAEIVKVLELITVGGDTYIAYIDSSVNSNIKVKRIQYSSNTSFITSASIVDSLSADTTAIQTQVNSLITRTDTLSANDTSQLSGTTNKLAKFTATNSIGNSIISDNGSIVSILGSLSASSSFSVNSLSGSSTRFATIDSTGLFGSSLAISNFVSGTGSTGNIPKWNNPNGITNSIINDNGSLITVNGGISATGSLNLLSLSGSGTRFLGIDSTGVFTTSNINISADSNGRSVFLKGLISPIKLVSSNYTVVPSDVTILTSATPVSGNVLSVTLFSISATDGVMIDIKKIDTSTNDTWLSGATTSETFDGSTSIAISQVNASRTLKSFGGKWYLL